MKIQQIQDKIQAEKKAESMREDSLTSAVEEFKKANDAWLNTVEDNKPKGTKFIVRIRVDSTISNPAKIFQKL